MRKRRYDASAHRAFARAAVLAALAWLVAVPARAQHATAFDLENGSRAYQGTCAACHGPDGNLIAGIDFGRGAFRRQYTDDLTVWKTAVPAVIGTGALVEWIDSGPPKTDAHPNSVPTRIYRIAFAP